MKTLPKDKEQIVKVHEQRYPFSCVPSSIELVLKLEGVVGPDFYDLQEQHRNATNLNGQMFDGFRRGRLRFASRFFNRRGVDFPFDEFYAEIDRKLSEGKFVIIALADGPNFHNWIIYDRTDDDDYMVVAPRDGHLPIHYREGIKKVVEQMGGTDILTY